MEYNDLRKLIQFEFNVDYETAEKVVKKIVKLLELGE